MSIERTPMMPVVEWRSVPSRSVLFTGKGGVGKTTVAAATAVALADAGRRVLLVSTDPASNLGDVFGMRPGVVPSAVPDVPGLDVIDLDPEEAANGYRRRVTDPYRGVLSSAAFAELEEKLAGACTVEVAAFDAFARLLVDDSDAGYDHILFDTAPTGHTLRLLSLPAAWNEYLGANPDATSCLGPMGGLQDHRSVYAAAVSALGDATATTLVLVARPDRRSLQVAADAAAELKDLGITNQRLVVNGVLEDPLPGDAVAEAYAAAQRAALTALPAPLDALATSTVPLIAIDLVGVDALRRLVSGAGITPPAAAKDAVNTAFHIGSIDELIDELATAGRGVVLVTGKGGVGKTTIATLLATGLAQRGHRVHLSTTDPAGVRPRLNPAQPTLTTGAIDVVDATRVYVEGRLEAGRRSGLDAEQLALLAEDLRSPCSQEVAVFQEFRQLLRRGRDQFVVIDTAPTGHTLLLLDVTGSFHRQVMQGQVRPAGRVVTPLMWLQDPAYTRLLIVTLAETTPVSEAAALQDDLRRAGIEPFGWVVNALLSSSGTRDPTLAARARLERRHLTRVRELASRVWAVDWRPDAHPTDPQPVRTSRPSLSLASGDDRGP